MQFLVIGLDGKDDKAAARRAVARPHHIKLGDELLQAGHLWYGAALFDEAGNMNGSMYLMNFKDRDELQTWLDREPYITGDVWKTVDIHKANVRDPWQFSKPKEFYEEQIRKGK